MLKALELVGFKSFADKTRFEFPPGITVVVGPNGSGKSNIVDAIKWVLGEQSVKSLRGKEMADVIFNGSGTRRGMNSAEITLTFDNSKRLLDTDSPEVHITRRVYRSGEGEYLINRAPSRLRDIRDLLSGTGMGTHAYSVIEQGKVDVLLQSSAQERRVIFEEAAGISRFKARKLESLRRLDRVEQNLLRLSDIVDEVESRLRSVRLQAGKARRYKEYTDRLQELRTQVGLVDWRHLTDRLEQFEAELQSHRDQRDAAAARAEAAETGLLEIDGQVDEVNDAIRRSETRIAANRERIAACESTIEHERTRSVDLATEVTRRRQKLAAMNARECDLREELRVTETEVEQAEQHHREISVRLVDRERALTGVIDSMDQLRGENEQRRAAYLEQMRLAAELGNEISALKSQVTGCDAVRDRAGKRLVELDRQLEELATEIEQLRTDARELTREVDDRNQRLEAAKTQLLHYEQQLAARQEELAELRQRRSATAERVAVLEELHRKREGLSAGVKQVLAAAQAGDDGPFRSVCGLVADLFRVSVEIAPLVDVALGAAAHHVVLAEGDELLAHLKANAPQLPGRVGFVRLDLAADVSEPTDVDLKGKPGVLGRADRFVETDPTYVALAQRLLGRTWIVEKLAHALALKATVDSRLSYVTLAGEWLGVDGTLIVGPPNVSTGLVSRQSQLRALQTQLGELGTRIGQLETTVKSLTDQITQQREQVDTKTTAHRQAIDRLAEQRFQITATEGRRGQLTQQREVLQTELKAAETQHAAAEEQLAEVRQRRTEFDTRLADMETRLENLNQQLGHLEDQRHRCDRETTEIKVELAKSEERLRNLRTQMRQYEQGREEHHRALAEGHQRLAECADRAKRSQWNILTAESEVAELYLHKETFARETVALINQRETCHQQRTELTAEVQQLRSMIRKLEDKIHKADLAANEVRYERNSLASRLRDDYNIELAELEHDPTEEEQQQRDQVQQEIDELRRKISNIGNVNLEALAELEELETRHESLAGQYHDLVDAKNSLVKIIEKINADSRRLFSETLATVRGHFQQLFRDLFGGGQGDIILDEDIDILESGIEIVARPPGKEPRSISLLSGGEKTLTCVALLLAIFRSRPSPFCVLDEVDAALDEANIDRFTKVLQDFLTWTQFIIVTHSKKTMTCANTIYGVTMQESGISKQVSVRFEDVSEDGHINPQRLAEAEAESQDEADDEHQAA